MLIDHSKNYLPDAAQQTQLRSALQENEASYDPAAGLIKRFMPETANHYHSRMVGVWTHPFRQSAQYASDLIDTGDEALQKRAFNILETIMLHQDT